jgi:ectoine hydroxylase-related dioxygenase (phytanoyl-CoA dioxygenase family)
MALPITFSKSFIKQLMDYPRYLGYDKINEFDEEILSLLGYNSRVPSNLNEWYQPEHNRFYKKNQD